MKEISKTIPKIDKRAQGKRNKASGAAWEHKVRADLESKGWFVSKFQNNVELPSGTKEPYGKTDDEQIEALKTVMGHMCPAKRKYNPFNRAFSVGTGFPDFIAWKDVANLDHTDGISLFEVIGVEAKSNGSLTKIEKAKCKWLIEKRIFCRIIIAKKKKEGRKVVPEYINFKEKYMKNKKLEELGLMYETC